jgi:ELWxxDGT repeat protein
MIADIHPGPEGSGFSQVIDYSGRAYFAADDGINGRELWSTDGTAAGTAMVSDLPGSSGIQPAGFANIDGVLYFSAEDSHHGRELWRLTDQAAPTLGLGGTITYRAYGFDRDYLANRVTAD